jgi:hypothetical protein
MRPKTLSIFLRLQPNAQPCQSVWSDKKIRPDAVATPAKSDWYLEQIVRACYAWSEETFASVETDRQPEKAEFSGTDSSGEGLEQCGTINGGEGNESV